jgi:hypothetical protein
MKIVRNNIARQVLGLGAGNAGRAGPAVSRGARSVTAEARRQPTPHSFSNWAW